MKIKFNRDKERHIRGVHPYPLELSDLEVGKVYAWWNRGPNAEEFFLVTAVHTTRAIHRVDVFAEFDSGAGHFHDAQTALGDGVHARFRFVKVCERVVFK